MASADRGLARMLFPFQLAGIAGGLGQGPGFIIVAAIVLLLVGGFLSFKSNRAD
jgi:hypothetical protein